MVGRTCALGASLLMGSGGLVSAQKPDPGTTRFVIPSMAGQDLFSFYCAPCHGRDAKGNGPVAAALKSAPPDLSRLSLRNGGTFPRGRVVQFIAGGGTTLSGAHGSGEMPVWGPIFFALDPSDERMALIRVENTVQYLESIQVK